MISKLSKGVAVAALLGSVSGLAQAVTVTFGGLIAPAPGDAGSGLVYSENGLTFVGEFLQHWGQSDPQNADPGGATLYHSEVDPPVTVTMTAGGNFNLTSFALAEADNDATPTSVEFGYTDGSGTFSRTLVLDAAPGLQTFAVNTNNITSFSLGGIDFQVDNVVYTPVAVVPEPATYGLMAAGLLVVGALSRRGGFFGPRG